LLICVLGAVAIFSSTMSKNPVLNPFARYLGTPPEFLGIVAAASTVPGVLISLPAGSLSDIFGRKRVLLASSIVFTSAPFLYVLITSWWQLILVRFYHGFATAMFIPVARAAIAERYASKRGEKISTFSSSTIVGRTIAPFAGGFILSVTVWDFRTLYIAVGVAGIAILFITLILLKEKGSPPTGEQTAGVSLSNHNANIKTKSFQGLREVFGNIGIMFVSAMDAAAYYVYGALEFFLIGYLKEIAQLDASLIGIISGVQLALIPIFGPLMGRLSDKIGRAVPITAGLIVSGLPLLIIPYATQFPVFLIISATYGLGFTMVTAATPALVGDLASRETYGTAMGFLATIMDVGQTLGPIITGLILATFGYSGSFFSLAAILLSFGILFAVFQKMSPDSKF